jgi:hypothetical protein
MIDSKMIPDEVVERLCEGLSYWDREATRAALAAALNAWPRVTHNPAIERYGVMQRAYLILPLPKEGADE